MRCYVTGEECDCGGGMDDPCPLDEMTDEHDVDEEFEMLRQAADDLDDRYAEYRSIDMSHQLDDPHELRS
jgi:hypothetical protein